MFQIFTSRHAEAELPSRLAATAPLALPPIKRKSLPEIAKVVGISSPQPLHHFIANSPWSHLIASLSCKS